MLLLNLIVCLSVAGESKGLFKRAPTPTLVASTASRPGLLTRTGTWFKNNPIKTAAIAAALVIPLITLTTNALVRNSIQNQGDSQVDKMKQNQQAQTALLQRNITQAATPPQRQVTTTLANTRASVNLN